MLLSLVFIIHGLVCSLVQQVGRPTGMPWLEARGGEGGINHVKMEEYGFHYKYPHPAVTTDCVIFGFDGESLKVLLIERGYDPYKGCWAFPGGFLEMDESADEGARRELKEETGLETAYVKQFHTFSTPDRDPRERVISVAYYSLVRISEVRGMDDAAQAKWFPLDAVPQLAFDHREMLHLATEELRKTFVLGGKDLDRLTEGFTKEEVEKIREVIR